MTGVVYRVSHCDTRSPPTIAMPSGRRSSEPAPRPMARSASRHQRREGRHHDRAEAQQAGFVDRLERALALFALGAQREVDHHDRVLLDDADQEDDADDRDDGELVCRSSISIRQRADAGGGQGRQDRDRDGCSSRRACRARCRRRGSRRRSAAASSCSDAWKACAVPWNAPVERRRHPQLALHRAGCARPPGRSPHRAPG